MCTRLWCLLISNAGWGCITKIASHLVRCPVLYKDKNRWVNSIIHKMGTGLQNTFILSREPASFCLKCVVLHANLELAGEACWHVSRMLRSQKIWGVEDKHTYLKYLKMDKKSQEAVHIDPVHLFCHTTCTGPQDPSNHISTLLHSLLRIRLHLFQHSCYVVQGIYRIWNHGTLQGGTWNKPGMSGLAW